MLSLKARRVSFLAIFTLFAVLGTHPGSVSGQNCGCATYECCSRFGYCGTGDTYCGHGCRSGRCYSSPEDRNIDRKGVSSIVTDEFFNAILDQADEGCPGKGFYTRAAFLEALSSFPNFGTDGSADVSKREIAAFFAHVTHETGYMCHIEELNGTPSKAAHGEYCDRQNTEYPCKRGKAYYGRGPVQLSWNFNYGAAGDSIGFDGLNDPDIVGRDRIISFKTGLWFWMNQCHRIVTSGKGGFGGTIRAINGPLECNGANPSTVRARVEYYREYCDKLGVDPGTNLSC